MTPTKSSEKIKLYLVMGLALIAAVVAYFRFIHKADGIPVPIAPGPPPPALLDPAPAGMPSYQRPHALRRTMPELLDVGIRDIFMPPQLPEKPGPPIQSNPSIQSKPVAKAPAAASPASAPPLNVELKGTVVGGNEPLAIINDKFMRLGEKIGDYQVVEITPTAVHLRAGKHHKVIQVLNPSQK